MRTEESPPSYSLEFDEASNTLFGIVNAVPKHVPTPNVTGFDLKKELMAQAYQDFLIPPVNLNNFLKNLKNKKVGRYTLGEKRDAKVEVLIANDRLSASLRITKAWGGKKLNNAKIIEAIKHNKIAQECILIDALKKIAEHHHNDMELLFAKGTLPVAGHAAKLVPLVRSRVEKDHDTASQEAIDQRDIYQFALVEAGQPLLEKIPATPGIPGKDVMGKLIPALAGPDLPLAMPFTGVEFAADNENVLVAAIKGHPVYTQTGVKVDPILLLDSVNIHSGNIEYDGSVLIKENVESGFMVIASGDIHVKGQVEKASLTAKGSITISCGILGDEDEGEFKAQLNAGGDIRARFINLAIVKCGGDLHIDEYIMQSNITTSGKILVGQQQGRGRIIGGKCRSESTINAKLLGSEAYVHTTLILGKKEGDKSELDHLHANRERRLQERTQLKAILEKIQAKTSSSNLGRIQLNKENKIRNTIQSLDNQINKIGFNIERVEHSKVKKEKLKVHISGVIYPNVSISICGVGWHCEEETRHKTFFLNHRHLESIALENQ